jgi:hypothetical protein
VRVTCTGHAPSPTVCESDTVSTFRLNIQRSPKRFSLLTRWPDLDRFSLCQHLLNSARNFESIGSPTEKHERTESKKSLAKRLQRQVPIMPQEHTSQKANERR